MKDTLMKLLSRSRNLLGPVISIRDASVIETLKESGPDLFIVDMEHSLIDLPVLQNMNTAAQDIPVIARVRGLEKNEIKKVLDTGVHGIIVPGISGSDDAKRAVEYSRLPPHGSRGAGPGRASGYGYRFKQYLEEANDVAVIVQIETIGAYDDLENILSVDGLNGYFIGPMDLTISLGIDYSWQNLDFIECVDRIVEAGHKHGLIGGIFTSLSSGDFQEVKNRNFNFIMFGSDRQAMQMKYYESMSEYRKI